MRTLNRRDFLHRSAGLAGAAFLAPSALHGRARRELPGPIGFQSWVVRDTLTKDFPGELKKRAKMGYQHVEMCSPPGYAGTGFERLAHLSAKEMKTILTDAGIGCTSFHYNFHELRDETQARIDFAGEMGLDHMVASSLRLGDDATLDDWKQAADQMNVIGEQTAKHGIQLGFHNHNGEFRELEGQLIYDVLLDRFDPELVKLQFQVWVVSIGYQAADYFRAHPGRFMSAHLADWSGTGEERVPVGQGVVDWVDFFEAGKVGGLEGFYVEMAPELLPESAAFLQGMA